MVQHIVGGLGGLVFAMLMETVLLIIRTNIPPALPVEEMLRKKPLQKGVAPVGQQERPEAKKER